MKSVKLLAKKLQNTCLQSIAYWVTVSPENPSQPLRRLQKPQPQAASKKMALISTEQHLTSLRSMKKKPYLLQHSQTAPIILDQGYKFLRGQAEAFTFNRA